MGPQIVLHVGCGQPNPEKLHPWFRDPTWREIRLDIDPSVRPDIVASVVDLHCLRDECVDAIWSSHTLEHLFEHECKRSLAECVRILKPHGFLLINTPDLVQVAAIIARHGVEAYLYDSPAGAVYAIDTVFGMRSSIERGNFHMMHKTAFSAERLGRLLLEAGFAEARVWEGRAFDLWGVGLMNKAAMEDHDRPVATV